MVDLHAKCSFCGKLSDPSLQMFRPEENLTDAGIAICEECVLTCAKAVDVEQRLSERPVPKPPGDAVPDSDRQARSAAHWEPFRMGNLELEWSTERAVIVSVRRVDNHERCVVERFPRAVEPTIDDAETIAEDYWAKLHG